MSTAKVGEIMNWLVERLGLVDDGGFCVPLSLAQSELGECLDLTDAALNALEEGESHE